MDLHDPTEIRSPGRTTDAGDRLGSPMLFGLAAAGAMAAAAILSVLT